MTAVPFLCGSVPGKQHSWVSLLFFGSMIKIGNFYECLNQALVQEILNYSIVKSDTP